MYHGVADRLSNYPGYIAKPQSRKSRSEGEGAAEREIADHGEADGIGETRLLVAEAAKLRDSSLYEARIDEQKLVAAAMEQGRTDVSGAGGVEARVDLRCKPHEVRTHIP